jgi:xylan 1,4-beta-xylosidase
VRYSNPVIPGFHPDPSICRVGQDYYLVNSSFEYFPGVPIFHSRDLVNWRQIGYCLTRTSQLPLEKAWISGGVYAPTIRWHQGTFYMITTNAAASGKGGNFYVTATDPAGPWSEPVWIPQDGIDPDLFFDEDGTVYVTSSGRSGGTCRIVQSRLDLATGTLHDTNRDLWDGTGALGPEGPHIYRVGEWYFLMIAEGGTEFGHMEVVARSKSPRGPWEVCPRNPILTHRSSESPIQCTGHADLVQAHDGSWWAVFLGVRVVGYHRVHLLGRETFLAPVSWSADGWPVIGDKGMTALSVDAPLLPQHPLPKAAAGRDDFDAAELGMQWNYLRNPVAGHSSLSERPGWLTLHGPANDINNMFPTPCLLGRRQEHLHCAASTLIQFEPQTDRDEAGMVVWQNMMHHYEVAVTRRAGRRAVIVRRRIGTLWAEVACEPADGDLVLLVEASPDSYQLAAWRADGTEVVRVKGESRYLSTEVGGLFTGVYLGLYATGNGRPCATPACFDWFDYEPREAPVRKGS